MTIGSTERFLKSLSRRMTMTMKSRGMTILGAVALLLTYVTAGEAAFSEGKLYVSENGSGEITEVDLQTGATQVFANNVTFPSFMTFAYDGNDRLWLYSGGGNEGVYKIRDDGLVNVVGSQQIKVATGVAFDFRNRVVYVAESINGEVSILDDLDRVTTFF
ncbi:MAG: hypothetical protein D6812_08395, partial [Deltaproteobacteria bacterium]